MVDDHPIKETSPNNNDIPDMNIHSQTPIPLDQVLHASHSNINSNNILSPSLSISSKYTLFMGHVDIKGTSHMLEDIVCRANITADHNIIVKNDLWINHDINCANNINVKGDVTLTNSDCAEEFDISSSNQVEPGTVMVLNNHGWLEPSQKEYDKKVVGVISGAGGFKPGIILDKHDKLDNKNKNKNRMPISLMGKVYCKVDATHASIEIGDLLTTSSTSKGHAMKAGDPYKAFGSVIGKALGEINEGLGMIPVLVTLQ